MSSKIFMFIHIDPVETSRIVMFKYVFFLPQELNSCSFWAWYLAMQQNKTSNGPASSDSRQILFRNINFDKEIWIPVSTKKLRYIDIGKNQETFISRKLEKIWTLVMILSDIYWWGKDIFISPTPSDPQFMKDPSCRKGWWNFDCKVSSNLPLPKLECTASTVDWIWKSFLLKVPEKGNFQGS